MNAKITLFGMYQYAPEIFDGLTVPKGADKGVLIDNIILHGGEFAVVYPDVQFLAHQIATLSRVWSRSMERTWQTLQDNYNPLHNFDRHETGTTKNHGTASGTNASQDENEMFVQGDTASTYTPASKTTGKANATDTSTNDGETVIDMHLFGNIGVQTSGSMVVEEISIRTQNSFADIWARKFIEELCIGIY